MAVSKVDSQISVRIANARDAAGLSEADAAERAGISVEELALIESGCVHIDAHTVSRMAIALDKPIAWFFDQVPHTVEFPFTRKR